jgi:hypothetical protein
MSTPATPTIIVGVNSYLTLAQASEIAGTRLFASAWTNATDDMRTKAILTATALLDRMRWQGRKLAPSQALEWPRVPERCPLGYPLAADIIPPIVTATVELALHLLSTGELGGGPAIMQQMLGDSMVMHFAHVADEIPKPVRRLIEPYLVVSSANVAQVQF